MAATKSRPWGNVKPPAGSTVNWGDPISRGLVGCWLFNEVGGNIAVDIAKSKSSSLVGGITRTTGKFGNALRFDGVDDYVDIGRPIENVSQFTISFWLNSTSTNGDWFGKWDNWNNNGSNQQILFRNFNMQFYVESVSTAHTFAVSGFNMDAANIWYFICGIADGENLRSSINTKFGSDVALAGPYIPIVGDRWGIGRGHTGLTNGIIDNVRIYNRALNKNEVQRLYTEPFAGITEPRLRLRSGTAAPASTKYFIQSGGKFYSWGT